MIELPKNFQVTAEMVGPSQPDLSQQIQRRLADGVYRQERARLAAVAGDEVAWMGFPPIPGDDPAEYAPYWQRLSDVVTDETERENAVASWLSGRRFHGVEGIEKQP